MKSPKRRPSSLSFYSSSDEETARGVRRNTPKSENTQQVVVQIHFPKWQAKHEIVEHHPSSQGESSEKESTDSVAVDPHKHQEQCSSSLVKPRNFGESSTYSVTAQDGNGIMEETIQIEKNDKGKAQCDEQNEEDGTTLDQRGNEDFTTVKTSDNLENTKPGASENENNKPQDDDRFSAEEREEHADDVEQIQCVSKVEDSDGKGLKKPGLSEQSGKDVVEVEERGAVKPLENGKHSEGAEHSKSLSNLEEVKNGTEPTTEQLDSSANEVKDSGLTTKEDSSVMKGLENGHHPESAQLSGSLCPSAEAEINTRSALDQFGGNREKNKVECSKAGMTVGNFMVQLRENGESLEPTITREPLEVTGGPHPRYKTNPGVAQLSGMDKTENRIKTLVDQPIEDTAKVEGEWCASILTDSALTVKQDFIEDDGELFQRDSISECSSHSKASESRNQSTPFENDISDESYSDDSIHASDSFNFIEDEGKTKVSQSKAISSGGTFAGSKSVPNGDSSKQQQRERFGKKTSKTRSSPELRFRAIVPVIEDEGIGSLGHDRSHPRTSCRTCPARQNCIGIEDKRKQEEDKQSTVHQQRPSAPVKIPAPQNRLFAKLRDTPSGSPGSKWSECGSFVSAVGSIESFHTARSGGGALKSGGASSNDGSDHDSESNHSCNNKPHVLPISSSFVDVICAVNRLTAFACHLCKILCPDETSQIVEHAATAFPTSADEDLKNESLGVKRRLCHRLIQVLIIP